MTVGEGSIYEHYFRHPPHAQHSHGSRFSLLEHSTHNAFFLLTLALTSYNPLRLLPPCPPSLLDYAPFSGYVGHAAIWGTFVCGAFCSLFLLGTLGWYMGNGPLV